MKKPETDPATGADPFPVLFVFQLKLPINPERRA